MAAEWWNDQWGWWGWWEMHAWEGALHNKIIISRFHIEMVWVYIVATWTVMAGLGRTDWPHMKLILSLWMIWVGFNVLF